MKKYFWIVIFLLLGSNLIVAQNRSKDSLLEKKTSEYPYVGTLVQDRAPLTKKGEMFIFWGYNRAGFTDSDIRFKGSGYRFTLDNVVAHDRPSDFGIRYFDISKISNPQFNFRIGYFIKDNLALVVGTDHMKYVMDQNQVVDFKGNISDPRYAAMVQNGKVNLQDGEFLTFEHTDGLNYVNAGIEKYNTILNKKDFDIVWSYGAGAGILFPRSDVKLFDNERSDRYHVAGFGLDARANINFIFWNHLMARVEAKFGYINMPDIKTTLNNSPDKAMQDFGFAQINFGLGYTFRTKKK